MNPFLGIWRGEDEYLSEVEYTVTEKNGEVSVAAKDPSDGESADVSGVSLADGRLRFMTLWSSTGRAAQCVFELEEENTVLLTFTYTDHARLVRMPFGSSDNT